MNDEIDYVDRPRPGLGVWLALALSLLTTVAIWHWLRDDLPIRVVLPILGLLVLWEIVSTLRNEMRVAYGWTRDGFAVRRGGDSRVIPFASATLSPIATRTDS